MRHEYRLNGGEWAASNDRLEARIREDIAFKFVTGKGGKEPLKFGRDTWPLSLNAMLHKRETDPFKEWLESLNPWGGDQRLKHWLGDVFRVDDACELTRWASTFILLGAVWRTYRPGTKLDETPVLIGEQGSGKSTALRWLLPREHPEWFADGLHLASDPKTRAESLQGRVIVEAAEMAGSNRAELESLKAFLSRTDDGAVRLSYRRDPETMLRRCVIVGSTNVSDCLPNDPTGNRRFVAVTVHATDDGASGVRQFLDTYRGQLWAEALHRYHQGEHARLPDELKHLQRDSNEGHRRRDDILENKLASWLGSAPAYFTLQQAALGVGWSTDLSMRDQFRLGAALTSAGYHKTRLSKGGKRIMAWSKP